MDAKKASVRLFFMILAICSWEFPAYAKETVMREIDGKAYRFRCIDTDYFDGMENHPQMALYLCDTVIPPNTGSEWRYELQPDGMYGYIYHAGPVVNFGSGADYKYSNIHRWLEKNSEKKDGDYQAAIGVSFAFTGSTKQGRFSELDAGGLMAHPIGYQKMNADLFILSVEEALRYKEWLWRFNGSGKDDVSEAENTFCNAYWLRTPLGCTDDYDTGYVYVVDLEHGNIHPKAVCPQGGTGDAELDVTSDAGIRPAFLLPVKEG